MAASPVDFRCRSPRSCRHGVRRPARCAYGTPGPRHCRIVQAAQADDATPAGAGFDCPALRGILPAKAVMIRHTRAWHHWVPSCEPPTRRRPRNRSRSARWARARPFHEHCVADTSMQRSRVRTRRCVKARAGVTRSWGEERPRREPVSTVAQHLAIWSTAHCASPASHAR